jgi:DNA-binding MarR family transcriptional regulator
MESASPATSPDPEEPAVAPSHPRVAYVVGRLDRALRRHLEEGLRPHGLTAPQYTALSVLRVRGGLSNAQLARRSFITPQSMSEVVAALVEKGFVLREAHPTHGRILRTELTAAGVAVLARCDEIVDGIEEQMLRELTARERERLLASLKSCVRGLGAGLADV